MRTALICGVTGQDGAYLSRLLLAKGYRVVGTSRDAEKSAFTGLQKLGIREEVETVSMAPTDFRSTLQTLARIRPDEIYNLAGQSSVVLSFQQPVETIESVAVGVVNLLEAVRFLDRPVRIYQAGSSECFGDTAGLAADEETPFHPRSPYATAKAAAHFAVANYREAYGLYACTGILFNHESPLRPARFVTRKIVAGAAAIARGQQDKLALGNLHIHRDWGWAPEYVEAMWLTLQHTMPRDFVIATGESRSLEEFCQAAFAAFGLDHREHIVVDPSLLRPSDITFGRGNPERAAAELGWRAWFRMADVVREMAAAEP